MEIARESPVSPELLLEESRPPREERVCGWLQQLGRTRWLHALSYFWTLHIGQQTLLMLRLLHGPCVFGLHGPIGHWREERHTVGACLGHQIPAHSTWDWLGFGRLETEVGSSARGGNSQTGKLTSPQCPTTGARRTSSTSRRDRRQWQEAADSMKRASVDAGHLLVHGTHHEYRSTPVASARSRRANGSRSRERGELAIGDPSPGEGEESFQKGWHLDSNPL